MFDELKLFSLKHAMAPQNPIKPYALLPSAPSFNWFTTTAFTTLDENKSSKNGEEKSHQKDRELLAFQPFANIL